MSDISFEPAVEAAPVDAPAEPDLFEAGADQFPRAYVEKLRQEAADYRTKYAPYRDTFTDVDPDVQEYLLDLNKQLLTDPAGAAAELRELLDRIDPKSAEGKAVAAAIEEIPEDKPLTLKEWKTIQAADAKKTAAEKEVESIYDLAKKLDASYDKDTDDFGDLASLLYVASHRTKGDLEKAHALRSERFNKIVEGEVEKRLADIKSGARKWAPVSSTGSTPIEPKNEPKTFAEARKRSESRLARILQG